MGELFLYIEIMKTIEVNINDKKYKCNISLRTYLKYEEIFEMPSNSEKGIKAITNLFFASLVANNINFELSYEEYIDVLDDNMESLTEFTKLLVERIQENTDDIKKKMNQ